MIFPKVILCPSTFNTKKVPCNNLCYSKIQCKRDEHFGLIMQLWPDFSLQVFIKFIQILRLATTFIFYNCALSTATIEYSCPSKEWINPLET